MQVSFRKVCWAYEDNPVTADELYKGKRLAITGKISSIEESPSGKWLMKVVGIGDAWTIGRGANSRLTCEFGDDKNQLLKVTKGQKVSVEGECVSGNSAGLVFRGCKILD